MDIKCISWGGLKSGGSGGGGGRGGWGGVAVKSDREIVANLISQSQLAAATVIASRPDEDAQKLLDMFVRSAISELEKYPK
jgi:hypothetical protein